MTRAEKFAALTQARDPKSDLRRNSVRAALSSGFVSIFDFALRIGSTAVLARILMPEHFGLLMMATAAIGLIDHFKDFGLSAAAVQRPSISHEEATNLFWINFSLGTGLSLIVCAVSPLIAAYYDEPRLIPIVCALALNSLVGGAMIQHQVMLTRQLRHSHTALVRFGASLLSTVLAIVLAWQGADHWALVWREVTRACLLTAGMWLCFPWIPSGPCRGTDMREILRSGLHFSGANVFSSMATGADRLIMGPALGPEPVAIFRQAYTLLLVPMDQLLSPLYQVSTPGLSMVQSEDRRFERYFRKLLTLVCLATMPASVFVFVYAAEATHLLLGAKWSACVPVVAILCLSVFVKQAVGSTAMLLITRQRSKRYLQLIVVENIALIAALFIGVRWGVHGVAWADVAVTYLMIAPKLWFTLHDSPIGAAAYFQAIARPALTSLGMGAVLWAVKTALPAMPVLGSLIAGGIVAGASFLLIWVLAPGGKEELLALTGDLRLAFRRTSAEPAR